MSVERERAEAIASGASSFHDAFAASPAPTPTRIEKGIEALIDAGWIPPAQRDEELRQMAGWQRDARRAFEAVNKIADATEKLWHPVATNLAAQLRDALGDRFRTPEAGQ